MGSQTTYMEVRKEGVKEGSRRGEKEKERKKLANRLKSIYMCPHSKKDLRQQAEE